VSASCSCGCPPGCSCGGDHWPHGLHAPANRPGLGAVAARLGDYGDFFEAAITQLGARENPALARLGTREPGDATLALIDAWAVAADGLTFYNERLANEAYLSTSREDFSLRELAALVGYRPRPGVAASVPLAFQLDANAAPVEIPAGARAQTVPGPGETLQSFETTESLTVRANWSEMRPRLTRPPRLDLYDALVRDRLWLADASLIVHPGEHVLFIFNRGRLGQVVREVDAAAADILANRLLLRLKPIPGLDRDTARRIVDPIIAFAQRGAREEEIGALLEAAESFLLGGSLGELADVLRASYGDDVGDAADLARATADLADKLVARPPEDGIVVKGESSPDKLYGALESVPMRQPRAARDLGRSAETLLGGAADGPLRLAAALSPALRDGLYQAWRRMEAMEQAPALESIHLLRLTVSAYGGNAPPLPVAEGHGFTLRLPARARADNRALHLDAVYDGVRSDSYAVIRGPVRFAKSPAGEPDDA
jgi:hypothetical protein